MKEFLTEEKEIEHFDIRKALIVPVNSKMQVLIQDRRGHKKPDWGYFGGSIEKGETPLQAVIRESKEELSIDIKESDLVRLGIATSDKDGHKRIFYMYLYPTEQEVFNVQEGKGGHWLTFEEVRERLDDKDRFDEVSARIQDLMKK